MKRVLIAWIEQIIEFDSEGEWEAFHRELENGDKLFHIIDHGNFDGKYRVLLRRQYNNNSFPGGWVPKCSVGL